MTPRTGKTDGFRADIEGMRGLAVVVVVLYHAGLYGLLTAAVPGGFVGVDVFFVISGFLITGLLLREKERTGTITLLKFYARRGRRLLPAALIVLLVTFFAAMNLVAPLDRPNVGLDGAAAALSIGNVRFAMAAGDYFSTLSAPSPFLHFWSLAVEEQFYLVWPALILLVARGLHARRKVMIALVAIVAISFAANLFITDAAASWAFYSLPTRAWQLGLGALLAVGALQVARAPSLFISGLGWLGLGAVAVSALTFDSTVAYPGMAAVLPSLGALALLASGTARRGPGRLLSIAPLRFLGKISYSLYLVHWPILVLAPFVLGRAPDPITVAGLVGLSVAFAYVCWAAIETPFRTRLPRLNLMPGRTVSIGLASMIAVMLLAAGPSISTGSNASIASAADALATAEATDAADTWADAGVAATPHQKPSVTIDVMPTPTADQTVAPTAAPIRDIANSGALPAGVKPSLAKARADEERLRGDGCLAFEDVTDPANCVYGDKSSKFTVALVGDSHAAQWFPALERLAKHEGWEIVTFVKVSCAFIDMPVANLSLKREYRECEAFDQNTLARLRLLKPDLTLVSMSRTALHPMHSSDNTVTAKAAAVARMIAKVPGKVAIIVDTPYAKTDVPACLSANTGAVEACAIPRKTAFTQDLGDVEAAAARTSGAGFIDLTSKFVLGDGAVPVVINGMIVYRDECHMTATFARSLAPALGLQIRAFLTP
ncbi:MAG: acyltransferase family protein [Chloroflexota bacterium]